MEIAKEKPKKIEKPNEFSYWLKVNSKDYPLSTENEFKNFIKRGVGLVKILTGEISIGKEKYISGQEYEYPVHFSFWGYEIYSDQYRSQEGELDVLETAKSNLQFYSGKNLVSFDGNNFKISKKVNYLTPFY